MKKKKIIIAGIGIVVVLSTGVFAITRDLSYMRDVELRGVNLTTVADGHYTGTFEHGRFTNTLTVQVTDNQIQNIAIDNDVFAARVTNVSDEVFRRVIEAQNTEINTVTGATATMTAYLKAIENALSAN